MRRTFTCEGTIRISGRGKLCAAGSLFQPKDNVVPVTGGTRDLRGVGGTLKVYDLPNRDTVLVFQPRPAVTG